MIKSGQDFQEFSDIKVIFNGDGTTTVTRKQVLMDVEKYNDVGFTENMKILNLIEEFEESEERLRSEDLAYFEIEKSVKKDNPQLLTFSDESFRTRENAISNLIADIVLTEPDNEVTEVVLINGGNFRNSANWSGFVTTKQLYTLLPIDDQFVQLKVRGSVIR